MKLYVNGVQETAFGTANYPNQDTQLYWNVGGSYYPKLADDTQVHLFILMVLCLTCSR